MVKPLLLPLFLACAPLLAQDTTAEPAERAADSLSCADEKLEADLQQLKQQAADSPYAARQVYLRYGFHGHTEQAKAWAERFIRMLTDMSSRGDAKAMLNLATLYTQGDPTVPADPAKALVWLEAAQAAGNPLASLMLAQRLLQEGKEAEAGKSLALAYNGYSKLAEAGDAKAKEQQAAMLLAGRGTKADPAKAMAMYEELAAAGNREAQVQLFAIYSRSKDPQRQRHALQLAKTLADQGSTRMAYLVSCEYSRGTILEKNEAESARYLELATAEPTPDSEALYQKGWNAEHAGDTAAATAAYERAVSLGHDRSRVRLGAIKLATPATQVEGLQLLTTSATDHQSPFAAHELAEYHRRAGNTAEADNWTILASDRGYVPAMARRGMLHLNPFSPVDWSPTLAYRWWKQGDSAGDPACSRCIILYLYIAIPVLVALAFFIPLLIGKTLGKRAKRQILEEHAADSRKEQP